MATSEEKKGETLVDTLYARIDGEGEDATLLAYSEPDAGIGSDDTVKLGEVVEVGVYKLERLKKVRKVIEEI